MIRDIGRYLGMFYGHSCLEYNLLSSGERILIKIWVEYGNFELFNVGKNKRLKWSDNC